MDKDRFLYFNDFDLSVHCVFKAAFGYRCYGGIRTGVCDVSVGLWNWLRRKPRYREPESSRLNVRLPLIRVISELRQSFYVVCASVWQGLRRDFIDFREKEAIFCSGNWNEIFIGVFSFLCYTRS